MIRRNILLAAFPALLILFPVTLSAQEKGPELVTDRPDQTESSSVVPAGSIQIETGASAEFDRGDFTESRDIRFNSTLLRYGLGADFELRLGTEYLETRTGLIDSPLSVTQNGFAPLHTGFKVQIAEESGFLPQIALLGGMNWSFLAGDAYSSPFPGGGLRFAFGHTLSQKLSIGYNLGASWNGEQAGPEYFYSAVLGFKLTEKLGAFIESFGNLPEQGESEHLVDGGVTFLVTPVVQLDLSGGPGLNDGAPDGFISGGISVRLNNQ